MPAIGTEAASSRAKLWVCLGLAAAALAVYWPVREFEFVNYDDGLYVFENPHVQPGLTWEGVKWAFGHLHGDRTYWHPLAWVSHMVDCRLFGLHPAGHHLVNVLFHVCNTVMIFLAFLRMTGSVWRCAVLAGLFGLHPLQVDTAAWVAERKNALAAFFALLTLWAYAHYAERSRVRGLKSQVRSSEGNVRKAKCKVEVEEIGSSKFDNQDSRLDVPPPSFGLPLPCSWPYVLSLGFYALSLMSKPVLVTVPFLLLLLDYWPLRRFQLSTYRPRLPRNRAFRLALEKLPFLALAAASSAMTILSHHSMGMLEATVRLPLGFRLENAFVSYARYLGKAFWPSELAVFYPLPAAWPPWTVALSGLLLLVMSVLAIGTVRRRPYLFVGWFWFVGVLVPFVGLIQVGAQAMADRFAYFALVGLFLALVWTVAGLTPRRSYRTTILAGVATFLLLACGMLSRLQARYWRNSMTLFEHALAVNPDNFVAHLNLGNCLRQAGKLEEARRHLTAAAQIGPYLPETHYELARVLLQQNKIGEAIEQYRYALRLRPNWDGVLNNLAWLLATHPRAEFRNGTEAFSLAERACQLTRGTNLWMVSTLAAAYAEAGRFPEAVSTQQRVCDLAAAQGQSGLIDRLQRRLDLYRSGQPYHEP